MEFKKVIILGGSGLIGTETIKKFIKNGYKVINFDLNKSNYSHKNLSYFKIDLSNFKDSEKKLKLFFSQKKHKKIDAYVNTSYPYVGNWLNHNFDLLKLDDFLENSSLNLFSNIWITKLIAENFKKNKSGSIVLMNSIYGILGQNLNLYKGTQMRENLTYAVIKGALSNSVRQFASFYSRHNVRINSICSGGVQGHIAGSKKKLTSKFNTNYKKFCPLGRLANPSEIANVIFFLISKESSYITGTNLIVDGGWSAI